MVLYNSTCLLSTTFGLHCGKRFVNHDQARVRKPQNLLGLKGKRLATFRSDSIMICRRMTTVSLKNLRVRSGRARHQTGAPGSQSTKGLVS